MGMNLIIVAVIALLILVVVVFIVLDKVNNTNEGTACFEQQGSCVDRCDTGKTIITVPGEQLCKPPKVCCPIVG